MKTAFRGLRFNDKDTHLNPNLIYRFQGWREGHVTRCHANSMVLYCVNVNVVGWREVTEGRW
jgi:hypothetical protein